MGRLDGKVALISGGARGQDATEAKLFAREGAKVVLGDIRDEAGKQVEAEIRAAGGEATYIHLGLLLDSRVVDVPMPSNAIVVTPLSWYPFFCNGLKHTISPHFDPGYIP
jgi:NAD(P)-dependent dehydrogenase (short-subunit alcohol dehydrogenase family)